MALVVNSNIASLNAQRNLNRTDTQLSQALQRISSGLRINSAKDDPAGLQIADRMTSQIRGMNQAIRNANDAISLAQTGDGALQEITNNLQRMRELAVQSRNATNTESDRESLDAEFQQLLSEIDRLATTTAFNGRVVLDGSLGSSVFQVGANVGETITVDINSSMRTTEIGLRATRTITLQDTLNDTDGTDDLTMDTDGDLVLNGVNVAAVAGEPNGRGQNSAFNVAKAINAGTDTHGVSATANPLSRTFSAATLANFGFDDGTTTTGTYTLTINGQQIFVQNEGTTIKTAQELATSINGFSETTGVTATVEADGDLVLSTQDGRNIEIQESAGGTLDAGETVTGYFGNALTQGGNTTLTDFFKSTVTLTSETDLTIDVAAGAADFLADTDLDPADNAITIEASGIAVSNVLTEAEADLAIDRVDQALEDVGALRGVFGAIQSRFESTIASLQATVENVSSARSRIQDADFAAETAALTRAQILQQAGIAILAQANALPQNALALLG